MKKISTANKVSMVVITIVFSLMFCGLFSIAWNAKQSVNWETYSLAAFCIVLMNGIILWNNRESKVKSYEKNGYTFLSEENEKRIYYKTMKLKDRTRVFFAKFNKDGFRTESFYVDSTHAELAMKVLGKEN